MAKQTIDLTTPQPNGKFGDTQKAAFTKVNENFDELYANMGNPGEVAQLRADLSAETNARTSADAALGVRINGNDAKIATLETTTSGHGTRLTAVETKAQENKAAIDAEVAARAEAATYLNNAKFDKAGGEVSGTTRFLTTADIGGAGRPILRLQEDGEGRPSITALTATATERAPLNFWATGFKFSASVVTSGAYQVRQGATDQQAVMTSFGRATPLVERWTQVLEQGEHLAFYRYPNGIPTVSCTFDYTNGNFLVTGSVGTVGQNAGFNWRSRNTNVGYVMYAQNNNMAIFCEGVGDLMMIDTSKNAHFFGNVSSNGQIGPSDPDMKEDLVPHVPVTDIINGISIKTGRYKSNTWMNTNLRSFIMADDFLETHLPNAVARNTIGPPPADGSPHIAYRGWDMAQLIAVGIKGQQEANARISALEAQVESLTATVAALVGPQPAEPDPVVTGEG